MSISGETVHYFIEYSTDGTNFYPHTITNNTTETFYSLGGSDSTIPWGSYYQNSGAIPPDSAYSFDSATQQYDYSYSFYYANSQTILYEIDQYKDI